MNMAHGAMNNPVNKDPPVDYVTKEDLKDHTTAIKEHISLLIAPVVEEQTEVKTILIGASKINGLVGRVKTLSTNLKIIYTFLVVVTGFLIKLFMNLL